MEFIKVPRTEAGSCNYCNRAKLTDRGRNFVYPYENVILVSGNNVSTTFCEECFTEFKNKEINDIEFKEFVE